MIAIAVLGTLFLYGWLSFGVVWLAVRWAKKRGRHPIHWGVVAGLIMYHLVFWDFLPTLVVYKYYCATKAGFWVYKTPEQWKAENPGVAETLTWREMSPIYEAPGVKFGFWLNERILWITKQKMGDWLPVGISEELLIDSRNNEILVKKVSIWTGRPGEEITRFWTKIEPYMPNINEFGNIQDSFKKLGREIR